MNRRGGIPSKAKDFKGAILRLIKELKSFKFLILLSLILAMFGSILSILSPNKLSDLTDEISNGLVINQENLEKISTHFTEALDPQVLSESLPDILAMNLSEENIQNILTSTNYTKEEKESLQTLLKNYQTMDRDVLFEEILRLPSSMVSQIFPTTTYEGVTVSTTDKVNFLQYFFSSSSNATLPNSILEIYLKDFEIDGSVISASDQILMMEKMRNLENVEDTEAIYQVLSEMPEEVQHVIEPNMNIQAILNIVYLLVGFYLTSAFFDFIEALSMTHVSNNFARSLRGRISKKINALPLKYFDQHQAGDTLSRVTNDVDMIAQTMNNSLSTLVSALTLFIGTTIMMFVTNIWMAITAILASLFGFIFMFGVLGRSQKYFIARQEELGNLNSHIEEIYSGLNVVKAYNGERLANEEFDKRNEKLYNCNRKSVFLSGLMQPMMGFIGNFGYVAVCIVGALLAMNGSITFGVIVAFISYVRLFTSPLSQIAQAMNQLQSTAAASERVFEFLDEEEMADESELKTYLPKESVKGNIEFKNVVFQYDGNDKPTIHNFNAKAEAGQKIAIVGPTGAGKTTMVNLLMKFYELTSGEIFIDGVSTKELTRENIHSLFTMVLQDTWIFDGSVKENIKYNRENISDERVSEVCRTVGLDHFIKTLSNGYDSPLSDSETVSSGQKQLLTIARGMIEDAPFLILDEATSNVDTRTEELVQKAMDKLMEGRTSFIIAHRLSTIKNADLILVMNEGNIIEQGTHEELMKKNGFYADLYNSQFEL